MAIEVRWCRTEKDCGCDCCAEVHLHSVVISVMRVRYDGEVTALIDAATVSCYFTYPLLRPARTGCEDGARDTLQMLDSDPLTEHTSPRRPYSGE